jgi:hypothetical protein
LTDGFSVVGFESSWPGIVLLQGVLHCNKDQKLIPARPWKTGQLLNVLCNPAEGPRQFLRKRLATDIPLQYQTECRFLNEQESSKVLFMAEVPVFLFL